MNQNNYGTREACQRLVDAGIRLKTDQYWNEATVGGWGLSGCRWNSFSIPAPSMGEVWRELPFQTYIKMLDEGSSLAWICDEEKNLEKEFWNTIPTDALIDLLIWVKAQKEGEYE